MVKNLVTASSNFLISSFDVSAPALNLGLRVINYDITGYGIEEVIVGHGPLPRPPSPNPPKSDEFPLSNIDSPLLGGYSNDITTIDSPLLGGYSNIYTDITTIDSPLLDGYSNIDITTIDSSLLSGYSNIYF